MPECPVSLEQLFSEAEELGCYWKLGLESLTLGTYSAELFNFEHLTMDGKAEAKDPAWAFANALNQAKLAQALRAKT